MSAHTTEDDAPPTTVETLVMQGRHRISSPDFMFQDGEWWVRTVAVRNALTCATPPTEKGLTFTADEKDDAVAFIRALVNAWDCCATCAGGVLAKRDRERDAARVIPPGSSAS